jgi:hypothetical protein
MIYKATVAAPVAAPVANGLFFGRPHYSLLFT